MRMYYSMKTARLIGCVALLTLGALAISSPAQTDGNATLEVTLLDYNGSTTSHYTVVWVTTESGTFIKSLRKQGPSSWTSGQWNAHCTVWNTARASSTVIDGYTSATAPNYAGTNSPVLLTWNGRDASGNLMVDGNYKLWIQYAEDQNVQGPYTTNGLVWTKGPAGKTNTYANLGANFSNIRVAWIPAIPATVAPTITSAAPATNATVGVPYTYTCTAAGTAPIAFSASGLPAGLTMSSGGTISGIPKTAGVFPGTITATNGTLPNASQAFSITVNFVPVNFLSARLGGNNLILSGTGPANGIFHLLNATNLTPTGPQWLPIATNTFDAKGTFSLTNAFDAGTPQKFFELRLP
jgi:hypothetical protein